MRRSVFILASDPTHEKILLLPDGNLPVIRFAPETRLDIWETAFFQRLADDQVGAGCWVLSVHDPSDDLIIVTVECRAPGAHQTWVAADAAAPADPAAAAAVAAWRRQRNDLPLLRAMPWLAPGWLDEAQAWAEARLRTHNIRAESGLLPVKTIFAGATFRMQTSAGLVYFKCHSPVYVREVAQTTLVAGWAPDKLPTVLGADPVRNDLLTREVPGPTLAAAGAPAPWFQAVRTYADLQVASLGRLQQPQAQCLGDWRVTQIRDRMAALIDRLPALQTGYADPLTQDELARLRALAPALARRCDEVAAYGVPDTLEHGDLHAQNIILTGPDQSPVILDWALSGVTHPFMGLLKLLRSGSAAVQDQVEPLIAAYLEAWRSYGTQQTLEDLLRLTAAWEPICHAYADAEWVEAYLQHSPVAELDPDSYLTWAIRRRQFYLVKSFRKLLR